LTSFDGYTREQLRDAYSQAWSKRAAQTLLTPLEAMIAEVIEQHPQYQRLIEDPDGARSYEAGAGGAAGEQNPFLHLGLHLAVREQIAVDRPPGVRELHRALQARHGESHAAEHALMDALREALLLAQRSGTAPDELQYLALGRSLLERR
jgi:hypothetical protein